MRYRWTKDKSGKLARSAVIYTKDEHKIDGSGVDPLAVYICDKLNNEGYETYIVGGAVRDLLLKKIPKDFDIASKATPARIKRIFSNSRIIGKRFRLVHVFFGEKIFEIATFRSHEEGADGNTFGTIEEDAKRRDFTMNALFYDPKKELVIDFVGGFKDINDRRVKPIIPLKIIFDEDPVRMVRAAKYAVIAGFSMPFFLRKKIKDGAPLLKRISPSRLTEELSKIIKSPRAAEIVEELYGLGLYHYLQPRAASLLDNSAPFKTRYFKTLKNLNESENDGESAYAEGLKEGLKALVRDFIDDNVDWAAAGQTDYKNVFLLARRFVLPMNPPRFELGRAVKDLFAEHNIKVKILRKHNRY